MTPAVTITVAELMAALKRWDEEAAANEWPTRTDEERHADNAEYVFGLLVDAQRSK